MSTDPAAYLAEVRDLIRKQNGLIDDLGEGVAVPVAELNAAQDRLAERAPALAGALEAVLKIHQPRAPRPSELIIWPRARSVALVCCGCSDDLGIGCEWPCENYRAIAAALPGREITDV